MTGNDLFREMGNINEKYVAEAEETKRSVILTPVFRRTLTTAACLVVCFGLYFGVRQLGVGGVANESAQSTTMGQTESMMMDTNSSSATASDDGLFDIEFDGIFGADAASTESEAMEEAVMEDAAEKYEELKTDSATITQEALLESLLGSESANMENNKDYVIEKDLMDENIDDFATKVEKGEATSLELAEMTEAGTTVFYSIHYDGTSFRLRIDYSYDAGAETDIVVEEYIYAYCRILEDTLSDGSRYGVMLLSNQEDFTLEDAATASAELAYIIQYVKE